MRMILLLAAVVLTLGACEGAVAPPKAAAQDVEPSALASLPPDTQVLDVRTPEEYAAGHIEGAININVDGPDFKAQVAQLDPDQRYVVHCAANVPGGRGERALKTMDALGFERLGNLVGGYRGWVEAGGVAAR